MPTLKNLHRFGACLCSRGLSSLFIGFQFRKSEMDAYIKNVFRAAEPAAFPGKNPTGVLLFYNI